MLKNKINFLLSLVVLFLALLCISCKSSTSDFTFEKHGDNVILTKYTGTSEKVVVPSTVKIGNKKYNVSS